MRTPFKKRYILYAFLMLTSPWILMFLGDLVLSQAFILFCCGALLYCLGKSLIQKVME